MLVVKIELWPKGDESKARQIGRIDIINDGTGTSEFGNYNVNIHHSELLNKTPLSRFYKIGKVTGFMRKLSPYHLLMRALSSAMSNNE